jgi:hypothetical protein
VTPAKGAVAEADRPGSIDKSILAVGMAAAVQRRAIEARE